MHRNAAQMSWKLWEMLHFQTLTSIQTLFFIFLFFFIFRFLRCWNSICWNFLFKRWDIKMRKRADLVYCYSKITVLLYQLTEKSIQSGDITQKKVSVLFGVKCRLFHFCALPSTDAHHQHTPSPLPSPSPLPGGISGPVWEWLWGATVGIWQRPWFGEPPHAEPHSAASALWGWEVSVSHTTQWPPQRRLQAPAHSCRDLGAAQVREGPG